MSSSPSLTNAKVPLRRQPPTTARGPRYSVIASAAFHCAIFATALLTFHRNFDTPQDSHVVPVDLVTIADKTNVAAQAPPKPEPEKFEPPTPPPIEPPPEPQMEAVEPAPDVPMPKFEVKKEEVKKRPTQQQDFAALLNKLTAPEKPVKNAKPGQRVIQGIGAGNAMTADIADALKSQIYHCWSPPTGAPDARDLVVDYDLRLNPDGTVGGLQLNAGSAMAAAANSFTRAAAEAASRAIYQCQPYRLPPDRYGVWREISPLRFDPRQMMQ